MSTTTQETGFTISKEAERCWVDAYLNSFYASNGFPMLVPKSLGQRMIDIGVTAPFAVQALLKPCKVNSTCSQY